MNKTDLIDLFKKIFLVESKDLKRGYLIYLLIFISYLELSPKLGNVWLRKGVDNSINLSLGGLVSFFTKPFKEGFFWKPRFWDINYYVGGYIFSNLISKVFNK